MTTTKWFLTLVYVGSTIGLLFFWGDPGKLTDEEMARLRGQSYGWCHNDRACAAFELACDTFCAAVGESCGKEREIEYPESCNADMGNDYCNGQQVQVVCAREWNCICRGGVPDEEGNVPLACTRDAEGSANPNGDGSTPVRGTITSDPLTCST
jgi:hypothetical protein